MINKKAIIPVISVILFVSVASVGFFALQSWYLNYNSEVNTQIQSSENSRITQIKEFSNNTLYLDNGYNYLEIQRVQIGNTSCDINQNFTKGVINIDVTPCIHEFETINPLVSVFTDFGVFSKKIVYQ